MTAGAWMTVRAQDAPLPRLALERSDGCNEVVVAVAGELDVSTSPLLRRVLDAIDGPRRVVVDVSEMTFIDCSALSVLIANARRLNSIGGELVVRHPRRPAYRVFEATGTLEALGVES